MTVRIRMSRHGAKKRPFYRIVVADIRSPRDGRYIEKVGTFDPLKDRSDKSRLNLEIDRIKHWLKSGAKPSDRVHRFLSDAGLLENIKRNNPNKAKPKKKALERIKAKEEALKSKQEKSITQTDAKKEETPAPADAKKEEVPAVAEAKKEETPAPADAKKEETPAPAEAKKEETP